MASWLGYARTTFTCAPKTISIPQKPTKKTPNSAEEEEARISLLSLVKETTPPCKLNPLLFNGHLQTCWTALKGIDIPITYQRKIFSSNSETYPGTYAVDFVVPTTKNPPPPDPDLPSRTTFYKPEDFSKLGSTTDEKPMLILLHGLSGGSHEIYLRHVLRPLCLEAKEEERWEACVVNARGCAHSKITTGVLYNARATWDVRQAVLWIKEKWPRRKLFGIGFSLGGNILTNYIGEEGVNCPLDGAVIVSNPWNLDISNTALQNSFLGLNVYSTVMGTSMKELFERHSEMILKHNPGVDEKKVRSLKYLHEFDRYVQCPTWGWPTEGAYYRDASSIDAIYNIKIPLLAIHAEDDPIACDAAAPYEEVKQNPNVVFCSTSLGGHLSWFEIGGERWFSRAAAGFLQKMAREVDLELLRKNRTSEAVEANGSVVRTVKQKPVYNPVVHKLQDSHHLSRN